MHKDKLRQLIADGKTQQVFEEILKPDLPSDKQWLHDLTALSGNNQRLEREYRLGTLSFEEYRRENTKINVALLAMIEEYEVPASTPPKPDFKLPEALESYGLEGLKEAKPEDWVRHRNSRTYVLDAEGKNLIALNLCGCGVQDASFLTSGEYAHLQVLNLSENPLTKLHLPERA